MLGLLRGFSKVITLFITETTDIARVQLLKHNDPEITSQICKLLETILPTKLFHISGTNLST